MALVAVRDRSTGQWWKFGELEQLCSRWGVELVQRFGRLEGLTLREINKQDLVVQWKGVEGAVIWTAEGHMYKVKSDWWFAVVLKQKRRWYSEATKQQSNKRGQKRVCHMEREDQRLMVIDRGGMMHPSLLLSGVM